MRFLVYGKRPDSIPASFFSQKFPAGELEFVVGMEDLDSALKRQQYDLIIIEQLQNAETVAKISRMIRHRVGDLVPILSSAVTVHEPQEDIQTAFDASADWLEWLGPDHKYRLISSAAKAITGYSAQEFMDNPQLALEIAHPDDREMLTEHWQEILNQKAGEITFEYRIHHREGGERWINHTCHPIIRDGEFEGHFATNRDITASKQAENELKQSYQTIQALLNAPSDVACVIDLDGTIRHTNETLAKIYQSSPGDLIGRNLWDLFTPEKAQFRKSIVNQVVNSRMMARVDDFGENGLFDSIVLPIFDPQGEVVQVAILARDISDRIKTEQALREREAMIQTIMENASVVLSAIDPHGIITFIDGKILDLLGFSQESLIGKNIFGMERVPDEIKTGFQHSLRGENCSFQMKGAIIPVIEIRFNPILDLRQAVIGAVAIGLDISESIKIQEELSRSKQETETILNEIDAAILVLDAQNESIYINPAGLRITGYSSGEEFNHDYHQPGFLKITDIEGNPINLSEMPAMMIEGRKENPLLLKFQPLRTLNTKWVSFRAFPVVNEQSEIQLIITIANDITQMIEAQAELEDAHHDLELKVAQRTNELNQANQELQKRVLEQQRSAAQSAALTRVTASINAQTELSGFLVAVCNELTRVTNYSFSGISLYEEETDSFQVASANFGFSPSFAFPVTSRLLYEKFLKEFGPHIIIPDIQQYNPEPGYEFLRNLGIRTLVSIPMFDDSDFVGSLDVASIDEVRMPSPSELFFLKALADQTKTGILKARLFEQLAESHQRLQTLSAKLVEIQEQERRKLAGELHDEIGQSLTSLRLNLDIISRSLAGFVPVHDEIREYMARANETTARLLDRIREISLDLRPAMLDDLGLIPALLALYETYSAQTDIQIRFKHGGVEKRFSAELETTVFRIIQEALTNVARHSDINEVSVRLWADPHFLRLQVEDRGVGFDPRAAVQYSRSSGLSGMNERAASCGGQLEIESYPGKGTCLTAEFPL